MSSSYILVNMIEMSYQSVENNLMTQVTGLKNPLATIFFAKIYTRHLLMTLASRYTRDYLKMARISEWKIGSNTYNYRWNRNVCPEKGSDRREQLIVTLYTLKVSIYRSVHKQLISEPFSRHTLYPPRFTCWPAVQPSHDYLFSVNSRKQ